MKKTLEVLEKEYNEKSKVAEDKIEELEKKILYYTHWAWFLVGSGLVILVVSIIYFCFTNTEKGFALNLLGDFLAGSVASFWALAGLFFHLCCIFRSKATIIISTN